MDMTLEIYDPIEISTKSLINTDRNVSKLPTLIDFGWDIFVLVQNSIS